MKIYERIDVWIRDPRARVYRCFRVHPDGRYVVQSCDFVDPLVKARLASFEEQLAELFLEEPPDERSTSFPSLEEAIRNHDMEFGNEQPAGEE